MKLKPFQRHENKGYYAATGLASQRQKILNGFRKLLPEMKLKPFQRLENKIHHDALGF